MRMAPYRELKGERRINENIFSYDFKFYMRAYFLPAFIMYSFALAVSPK